MEMEFYEVANGYAVAAVKDGFYSYIGHRNSLKGKFKRYADPKFYYAPTGMTALIRKHSKRINLPSELRNWNDCP